MRTRHGPRELLGRIDRIEADRESKSRAFSQRAQPGRLGR